MNHGLKLHPDGTLELTMPKDKKVTRVLVCEAGTQNGSLYYSDGLMEQYKWERDTAISQLKDLGYELGEKPRKSDIPDRNVGDMISRQMAIEFIHTLYPSEPILRMNRKRWEKKYKPYIECEKALEQLPSAQLEIIRCKDCKHYYGRPCGIVDWYNTADDFCSRAERKDGETDG